MKNLLISCALLLAVSTMQAQISSRATGWTLKSVGISAGIEKDMIRNFSGESFVRMTGQENLLEAAGINPNSASVYSGVCENPHLRFQGIWEVPALAGFELHTSLVAIINRVDAISYYQDYTGPNDWGGYSNNYVTINTWGSELAADAAVIKRWRLGPMSAYAGIGANVGYHFENYLNVHYGIEATAETWSFANTGVSRYSEDWVNETEQSPMLYASHSESMGNGLSTRAYLQGGVSGTMFGRLELGLEGRYGYGSRLHFEGQSLTTNLQSWGIFARWNLVKA